ncbi:MAG: ketoacyl-ACP synthase III [Actinomycetota bacterium]|nr:ketoacyl-ACP synthase III [Actinomycetota bacterium]MDQ6945855.1 ketoacyl-ACP synthase III [Actinomycetota bacterium]
MAPLTPNRGSAITGWATALPETVVTNEDLSRYLDTSDQWIVDRTGIRERRVIYGPFAPRPADPSMWTSPPGGVGTTASLAIEAGRKALDAAHLGAEDIDLLILCTTTPDQAVPATSSVVQSALGLHCAAFDLNAACAGFVYGLVTAASFISSGSHRVLVIGSETLSRIIDWTDRETAVLFGDGAGAVVVEEVPGDSSLLGWDVGVDGALQPILYCDLGGYLHMVGKEVFRRAVRATVDSSLAAMERAKVTSEDIALFVPHQANSRIIEAACNRLEIPMDRAAVMLDRTGNTSSASIPLALGEALDAGRVSDDDLILMSGFGAGMTWASAVWRWSSDPFQDGTDQLVGR